MNNLNHNVAILILTKNRPDFLIRQLKYYASVGSPHTVYIADSSDKETFEKVNKQIKKLGEKVKVVHDYFPSEEYGTYQRYIEMFPKIQEKYFTFIGDDDFQIPDSLSKCAKFLENNEDFATASGYSVSVRLINNGVYGKLERLADYPRKEILADSASERLIEFMHDYFVTIFSVARTDTIRKIYSKLGTIKDWGLREELMPCCLSIISGKAKIIDCLGFVRQIHKSHYELPDMFDWLSDENFRESWIESQNILANELILKDKISSEKAAKITKKAFWSYLRKYLSKGYRIKYMPQEKKNIVQLFFRKLRSTTTRAFPFFKIFYRTWIKKPAVGNMNLHYKVLQKTSPYYKDFKPILDSFTNTGK